MFPTKYELSKDAAIEVIGKIEHPLDQACGRPLCPCASSFDKAIVAAGELYVKNVNIQVGREAYLMNFQGFN